MIGARRQFLFRGLGVVPEAKILCNFSVVCLNSPIYGLSLMGIQVFVQNLFYGGALIIAVALSILVRRSETREPDIAKDGN
jgi:ABC-type xylose transport system permease subunit